MVCAAQGGSKELPVDARVRTRADAPKETVEVAGAQRGDPEWEQETSSLRGGAGCTEPSGTGAAKHGASAPMP